MSAERERTEERRKCSGEGRHSPPTNVWSTLLRHTIVRRPFVSSLRALMRTRVTGTAYVPALAIVASSQWPEATEVLLSHGANPNTLLHIPARGLNHAPVLGLPAANGSVAILRCLLLAGARRDAADATGLTALMSAAYMGHPDVVSVLIAHVMLFCPQGP